MFFYPSLETHREAKLFTLVNEIAPHSNDVFHVKHQVNILNKIKF